MNYATSQDRSSTREILTFTLLFLLFTVKLFYRDSDVNDLEIIFRAATQVNTFQWKELQYSITN